MCLSSKFSTSRALNEMDRKGELTDTCQRRMFKVVGIYSDGRYRSIQPLNTTMYPYLGGYIEHKSNYRTGECWDADGFHVFVSRDEAVALYEDYVAYTKWARGKWYDGPDEYALIEVEVDRIVHVGETEWFLSIPKADKRSHITLTAIVSKLKVIRELRRDSI